jgi:cytochrome c-type biogenesis protein CcmH
MFSFWLIAILFILVSLSVIIVILLRTYDSDELIEVDNAERYQQRLAELELDVENGLLSGNEISKVKKEYQLTLLDEDDSQSNKKQASSSSSSLTAVILLFLIPVFAVSLYHQLGQPKLIQQASLLSEFNNAENPEDKLASIEKMLRQLEQRLIVEPDDVDGWLMLTNSYSALERYPEALRAVDNLYRLRSEDPTVLLRYAEILSRTNGDTFIGRPTELINQALQMAPDNGNGLWLAGLAASERGEKELAINYWQRLVPLLEEGSKAQQQIKKYILIAQQTTKPNQQEALTDAASAEYKIQIHVSLSENFIDDVNADDTVFIYAQAINGPPIPIAIIRKKVSDMPLQVTLDDSSAMMPNNKLSDHKQVKLTARVSKNGNAIPESGDLIVRLSEVQTDTNEIISLNIDEKLP